MVARLSPPVTFDVQGWGMEEAPLLILARRLIQPAMGHGGAGVSSRRPPRYHHEGSKMRRSRQSPSYRHPRPHRGAELERRGESQSPPVVTRANRSVRTGAAQRELV